MSRPRPPRPGHQAARHVSLTENATSAPGRCRRREAAADPRARPDAPPRLLILDSRPPASTSSCAWSCGPTSSGYGARRRRSSSRCTPGERPAALRQIAFIADGQIVAEGRSGARRSSTACPAGRLPRARRRRLSRAGSVAMTATQSSSSRSCGARSAPHEDQRQTVGAPLLRRRFLYISVFGARWARASRRCTGSDYVVFIIPGLIMMASAINSCTTTPRRSCSRSSSGRSTTSCPRRRRRWSSCCGLPRGFLRGCSWRC